LTRVLRFALFGAGFWAPYQLAGWQELEGARCVAIYNRTLRRAEALAKRMGVPAAYDDAGELLQEEAPDFIDIVTSVETHSPFVHLAAERRVPVICQKPMATSLSEAEGMVRACRQAGVPFFVHENWRWQRPIRALKALLDRGRAGQPFRAHVQYSSSYPVFQNQPFLRELEQFMLTDMGSHILDVARFLFGEATSLYCHTQRIHRDIRGEDVATVMLQMANGMTVVCELSYASRLRHERFPEAFILVEAERGSLELTPDYWLRETTEEGTFSRRYPPPHYAWAEPTHDLIHASIVDCNRDILRALQDRRSAETTGEDNLCTVRLVYGAYKSASGNRVVKP
jgi:predicted dehydrogenase